jgi:type IV secretion system protein VirD4
MIVLVLIIAAVVVVALLILGGLHLIASGLHAIVPALAGGSLLAAVLVVIVILIAAAVFIRCTLFSRDQVRRLRWRIMFRLRPGPGFATPAEIYLRWGRWAAINYGRLSRPSMSWWQRATSRTTEYAARLGRGPYGRRLYVSLEFATLLLAPPRKGKTGHLGDRLIDHPGSALVHEAMRPDLYFATAGYRKDRPVQVFNPDDIGRIPSTFRWAMTAGCDDPAEAIYRAADLVGAVADHGEMAWWSEKARGALGAAVHAAGLVHEIHVHETAVAAVAAGIQAASLLNGDMGDVWAWAYGDKSLIDEVRGHPAVSLPLLGALTELDRPGKTADSIKITMSKSLEWLAVPALRNMVTGLDAAPFDVPEWIDSCGTIYMISPGQEAPSAPLFRCFASYVHRKAKAYAQLLPGRRLDPGLLFALDELDKCPVPLPLWLADSGGSGIQVVPVVHSTGQLEEKFGEPGLNTVMSTTGVKIFLGGNHHVRTLKDVSELCGTLPKGEQYENPVAPINFVTRLPRRCALVINDDLAPAVVRIRPYWKRADFRLGRRPALPVLQPIRAQAQMPELVTAANGNGHGNGHAAIHDTIPFPVIPGTVGPNE